MLERRLQRIRTKLGLVSLGVLFWAPLVAAVVIAKALGIKPMKMNAPKKGTRQC